MPKPSISKVSDDELDFYGRGYWLSYQEKNFGYPNVTIRSRTDLPERCLHWLRTTLKYKLPQGRSLELGSAHGGFVALLRWAGFDASGLELSPWMMNYARQTFDVPMLLGRVEEQAIEAGSLDLIPLMDVLEHLPDPAGTMRYCRNLLKPDGILLIQTPRFPQDKTYDEMVAQDDPFLDQLKAGEHLYLFSEQSIREFFHRLGADFLEFEPAIFSHYDMFLVVSWVPLTVCQPEEIERRLSASPSGRLVQALLDLDDRLRNLRKSSTEAGTDRVAHLATIERLNTQLAVTDADRTARLEQVQRLHGLLSESEQDRMARLEQVHRLQGLLSESGVDRTARLESIHRLEKWLSESEEDRAARLEQVHRLQGLLSESEQDRMARLEQVHRLQALLSESEEDRAARLEQIHNLEKWFSESEEDRAARLSITERQGKDIARFQTEIDRYLEENQALQKMQHALTAERDALRLQLLDVEQQYKDANAELAASSGVIDQQGQRLSELRSELSNLRLETKTQLSDLRELQSTLRRLHSSRVYRLLRRIGRWGWLEQALPPAASPVAMDPEAATERQGHAAAKSHSGAKLKRIAIDLTPLLPGGENGGAKLVATGLVRQLSQIAPDCEWVLLTSDRSHDELGALESHNVRRLCVARPSSFSGGLASRSARLRARSLEWLLANLPAPALAHLKRAFRKLSRGPNIIYRPRRRSLPRELEADLVFCPFTAPYFFDPTVPVVSVVHDLQYLHYPQFFSSDERIGRDKHFREACRLATKLVCVSEYVRGTVLENHDISPERVVAIHTRLFRRLGQASPEKVEQALDRLGLMRDQFLLYPANFWPHKNHQMLLTAMGMYWSRQRESDLKLVCTGAPDPRMECLQDFAERMGLGGQIRFPGFLPDGEFAALLQSCRAVIFPSLYEGFGMPILEAMAFGKPVLCSNATSLPEVAGDAALFFDSRRPAEIVSAIERIESDPTLVSRLIERGYQRLAAFGGPEDMAKQYFQVFREVVINPSHVTQVLHGVYEDGWTGKRLFIKYGASSEARHVEIALTAPAWIPFDRVSAKVTQDGNGRPEIYRINRSKAVTIRRGLPHQGGFIEVVIDPIFQPNSQGMNKDDRMLGCMCQACRVVSPSATVDLLERKA